MDTCLTEEASSILVMRLNKVCSVIYKVLGSLVRLLDGCWLSLSNINKMDIGDM